jgi:putative ABC transport system permease protein
MTELLMLFDMIPVGFMQSLILAYLALGIMIPFRALNFADLSAEGSYPFGACLCAVLLSHGFTPWVAIVVAILGGILVGFTTALLHIYLKINSLLAGIILATMLYSINLRMMGKPNIPLFTEPTIFSSLGDSDIGLKIGLLILLLALISGLIYWFLKTEKGLRLRATGLNPVMAQAQGVSLKLYILLGVGLGNGLNALSGALIAQSQGFAEVNMGMGVVINGLAAVMIGEVILGLNKPYKIVLAPIVGAIIFQQLQGLILVMGLQPSDFKLVTGLLIILTLGIRQVKYPKANLGF